VGALVNQKLFFEGFYQKKNSSADFYNTQKKQKQEKIKKNFSNR